MELSDSLIPTPDDLTGASLKLEGLASGDARVEDATIFEHAGVVDLDVGATGANRALTLIELLNGKGHTLLCLL